VSRDTWRGPSPARGPRGHCPALPRLDQVPLQCQPVTVVRRHHPTEVSGGVSSHQHVSTQHGVRGLGSLGCLATGRLCLTLNDTPAKFGANMAPLQGARSHRHTTRRALALECAALPNAEGGVRVTSSRVSPEGSPGRSRAAATFDRAEHCICEVREVDQSTASARSGKSTTYWAAGPIGSRSLRNRRCRRRFCFCHIARAY